MAPLIFAEKANFGFFLSGAGNFIIDTFLKENVVIWVGWSIINHSNLFKSLKEGKVAKWSERKAIKVINLSELWETII